MAAQGGRRNAERIPRALLYPAALVWASVSPILILCVTTYPFAGIVLNYYSVKADFSVWPDLRNTLLAGYVGL